MRIVIATPLYPPDIAEPAPYVKELARRLATVHDITVVAYGAHPEQVPGVRIIAVDKHRPLLARLILFFFALARAVRGADVLMVENGASVELPAGILARLSPARVVFHIGDAAAHAHAMQDTWRGRIERFVAGRAVCTLQHQPDARPEVLPYAPPPDLSAYETSWSEHLHALDACIHG